MQRALYFDGVMISDLLARELDLPMVDLFNCPVSQSMELESLHNRRIIPSPLMTAVTEQSPLIEAYLPRD
jgi:hypothetical protein